ncbi:MAG: multicopper oxidase domain-containing protein, partial [Acinetobacter sp.]
MLQLAIIGAIVAVFALLASNWNGGKNPPHPSNPPHPGNPSNPNPPTHPTHPLPAPTASESLISNPPLLAKNAKGKYDLIVAYKTDKLYNPRNGNWDQLVLRGYVTKPSLFAKKKAGEYVEDQLVGPQIRIKQGETFSVQLSNQLPTESTATCPEHILDANDPHCFNTTNLHTHGLWVSPQGNSDNVFLKFAPKEKFDYQYKIEKNHPAGTYWYHAHLHGSTAIQVSSGMAGPLIVEGSRIPKYKNGKLSESGDLDILFADKAKKNDADEKILLFQQIQYRCMNSQDPLNINNCQSNDIGMLEDYQGLNAFNSWGANHYYTSINGKVHGEIQVEQNQFNRWRMIHGGVRDTLGLIIKELPKSEKFSAAQTIQACSEFQEESKKVDFDQLSSLPMYTIAQDGLTMDHVQTRRISIFQPGYRHDAMLAFPTRNKYCIFDTNLNIDDEINTIPTSGQITPQLAPANTLNAQLLGWVNVKASKLKAQTPAQFLQAQAQKIGLSKEIQTQLSQLKLSAFVDHVSLMSTEIDQRLKNRPPQLSAFDASFGPNAKFGYRYSNIEGIYSFGDLFSGPGAVEDRYVRKLELGQIDEWVLSSNNLNHPYHIHVNPFQIVKVLDPTG